MISAFALVVSGCGGGGSSGGGGGGGVPAVGSTANEKVIGNLLRAGEAGNALSDEFTDFVRNMPMKASSGSGVYHSSGSSATTVTTEEDSLTIAMGSLTTVQSDDDTPTAQVRGENDYTVYYLSESSDTATPRVVEALAYTDRSATNTDYATFGYWLFSSAGSYTKDNIEISSFASGGGSLTPTSYLRPAAPVTATYKGDAVGVVNRFLPGESDGTFSAKVTVTATFDSTPTAAAEITDITDIGSLSIPDIVLEEASLANEAGGFLSNTDTDSGDSGDSWSARFYGNEAEVVSGTFSAYHSLLPGATGIAHFVGAFGARKEIPAE